VKTFIFLGLIALNSICIGEVPEPVLHQAVHLKTILMQADEAYYNRSESILSDPAYDALRRHYESLIATYPELKDTPTVGADIPDTPIPHTAPVLSLKKAYSDEEVREFINRCGTNQNYCIEPKIDGLTVILRYRDGLLTQALTRGNGSSGSDVTQPLIASGAVPLQLSEAPHICDVRGELFMTFEAFEALNERRIETGKAPLKSPRNTAAGSLRLDDCSEIAARKLSFLAFELLDADTMPPTHQEGLLYARNLGLPVIDSRHTTAMHVLETLNALNAERSSRPCQTDGLVIKVDDLKKYNQLGFTSRHPRGALARKYKEHPATTTLLRIEWSEGITGKITPVAIFEPIEINSATLSRASLYNETHLLALNIKPGDRIHVIRAGGCIPEVLGLAPPEK
jgi:DNA ligase (NAD+)